MRKAWWKKAMHPRSADPSASPPTTQSTTSLYLFCSPVYKNWHRNLLNRVVVGQQDDRPYGRKGGLHLYVVKLPQFKSWMSIIKERKVMYILLDFFACYSFLCHLAWDVYFGLLYIMYCNIWSTNVIQFYCVTICVLFASLYCCI